MVSSEMKSLFAMSRFLFPPATSKAQNADTYFFHGDINGNMNGVTRHLSPYGCSKDAYNWRGD